MPKKWNLPILCLILFFIDFISKKLTLAFLPIEGDSINIFTNFFGIDFSFTHMTNKGAAWGVFSSMPQLLIVIRIVLIIMLSAWIIFFSKNSSYRYPVSFIVVGAISNVVDFFLYGHVIDMIHFVFFGYDYPVFNVADSLIFIGTLYIIVQTFLKK